jgi:hypothetical protein
MGTFGSSGRLGFLLGRGLDFHWCRSNRRPREKNLLTLRGRGRLVAHCWSRTGKANSVDSGAGWLLRGGALCGDGCDGRGSDNSSRRRPCQGFARLVDRCPPWRPVIRAGPRLSAGLRLLNFWKSRNLGREGLRSERRRREDSGTVGLVEGRWEGISLRLLLKGLTILVSFPFRLKTDLQGLRNYKPA